MNWLKNFKSGLRRQILAASRKNDDAITSAELYALVSGTGYARSGVLVSWNNAICVGAVFGCVRVVSEDIAKVEFRLNLHNGRQINPALDHGLYEILAYQPNAWQTSFEFREMITTFAMMTGNGIAYITRGLDGTIKELIPLPPPWVSVRRDPGKWNLRYTITFPNGGGTIECGSDNIFHLRGPSTDGIIGLDVIRVAREAIGLAIAGEEHQARIAEGSLQAPGYLTTSNPLTKDQVEQIQAWLKEKGGVRNAGSTPLFQNGLEYKEIGVTGAKAEVLATRSFQVEDICRFFRVFPQMIGYTDKTATHGSAAEFFAAHVVHSLQPWATRWEQAVRRDLLNADEKKAFYAPKLMLDDLLRGDPAARGQFYKDMSAVYAITPNEARIKEGFNPFDDPKYDEPVGPVNIDQLGQMPEPTPPEPDVPDDPTEPDEDDNAED